MTLKKVVLWLYSYYVFILLISAVTLVKFADDILNTLCSKGLKSKQLACLSLLRTKKKLHVLIKQFFPWKNNCLNWWKVEKIL